jgi:hypothetical protein
MERREAIRSLAGVIVGTGLITSEGEATGSRAYVVNSDKEDNFLNSGFEEDLEKGQDLPGLFQVVEIGDSKFAFWKESIPVLTLPEGLDAWVEDDPNAVALLKRAEGIIRDAYNGKHIGYIFPHGWKLKFHEVIRSKEIT